MKLEYANCICPKCKNGNYMRWLGGHSAEYDVKCINCNSYFTIEELQVRQTNGDNLRTMTDEELARILAIGCHETRECPTICDPIYPYDEVVESCEKCWLDWLKKEADKDGAE